MSSASKKPAKSKAELMRAMRNRRKKNGLIAVTYWVTAEQIEKIEAALRDK